MQRKAVRMSGTGRNPNDGSRPNWDIALSLPICRVMPVTLYSFKLKRELPLLSDEEYRQ